MKQKKKKIIAKLIISLLSIMITAHTYAAWHPQNPPEGNEGTDLDSIIKTASNEAKAKGLSYKPLDWSTNGCLVSLPDSNKNTARVARVQSRMSAWIGKQTPDTKSSRVYLQRQGDSRVFLFGPAENILNMGFSSNQNHLTIRQRETANGRNEGVIAAMDHTSEVHYLPLSNITNIGSGLKAFGDGPLDGDRIGRMVFKVGNGRLGSGRDSYTVTALVIKLGGTLRVFGLCM